MDLDLSSLSCRSVKWHGCAVIFINIAGNIFLICESVSECQNVFCHKIEPSYGRHLKPTVLSTNATC